MALYSFVLCIPYTETSEACGLSHTNPRDGGRADLLKVRFLAQL